MENKRLRFKSLNRLRYQTGLISLMGGLILASFLVANNALAYDDDTVHPELTREIISFYELSGGKKLTEEQRQWIIQGSIDEEDAPRWLNHLYDPIYNRGLDSVWGSGYPAKLWGQYSIYQTGDTRLTTNLYFYSRVAAMTDFSYEAGIKKYTGNKEKAAYTTLGHILHLIEDMTVPEHTRNDPHPDLNDKLKSDYEDWTKKNSQTLTRELGKRLFNQDYKPIFYSNLENYFNQVATYSNKYFFGSHTINSKEYRNPKILWEDGGFGYGIDENENSFKLVNLEKFPTGYNLKNDEVMQDYWARLSRQAVINGAGVIQLFLNQAETARKIELAKQAQNPPKQSLVSQIINFFSNPGQSNQPALTIVSEPQLDQQPQIETEMVSLNLQSQEPVQQAPTWPEPVPAPKPTLAPAPAPPPVQTPPTTNTNNANTNQQTNTQTTYSGGGGNSNSSLSSNSSSGSSSANSQTNHNTSNTDTAGLNVSDVPEVQTFKAGDLVINEIMYSPDGADDKHEWVELYNNTQNAVTLTGGTSGWRFNDGSNHLLNEPAALGTMTVAAGGYAILADDAATFLQDHQGFSGTVIDTVMSLKNSTATIKLLSPDGTLIDEVTYYSSWGGNGNGKTLKRKSAGAASNDPNNWAQSGITSPSQQSR